MPESKPNNSLPLNLSAGQCATLACLLEATAAKPGNVHRGADFEDLTFVDLATSAVAIGAAIDRTAGGRVGATVLAAVDAMRATCGSNAYLGTILLVGPLAHVSGLPLRAGISAVLTGLDGADAADVYEAIRRARPGGLGEVDEHDVSAEAPASLLDAMRAAAERDLVARQYVNDFAEVFERAARWIEEGVAAGMALTAAIVHTHVRLMSEHPDSLIERKCGRAVALTSAGRAEAVLRAGPPGGENYLAALADLDFWLRSDDHRRNPGTTADLIAAGLYVLLREGRVRPPWQ